MPRWILSPGKHQAIMTPKARILIIDDEEPVRLVLQQALLTEGYEVVTAGDGQEALRVAEARRFDVILTDLILPKFDGFQILAAMRDSQPDSQIVVMSGGWQSGSQSFLKHAGRIGGCGTLAKPFSKEQLLGEIEKALARLKRSRTKGGEDASIT